jgi:hypothetical protein
VFGKSNCYNFAENRNFRDKSRYENHYKKPLFLPNGRGSGKTFKWRKPEPHEHNHHIIDGKTHVYNLKSRRSTFEASGKSSEQGRWDGPYRLSDYKDYSLGGQQWSPYSGEDGTWPHDTKVEAFCSSISLVPIAPQAKFH